MEVNQPNTYSRSNELTWGFNSYVGVNFNLIFQMWFYRSSTIEGNCDLRGFVGLEK